MIYKIDKASDPSTNHIGVERNEINTGPGGGLHVSLES